MNLSSEYQFGMITHNRPLTVFLSSLNNGSGSGWVIVVGINQSENLKSCCY